MIKKRTRPQPRIREPSPDLSDTASQDAQNEGEAELPVSELLELRKFRRARQGIDAAKLTKGDGKKKRRRKPEEDGDMPEGGLQPGAQVSEDDSDSEDPGDKTAKMRRAVRANNFTQQTNALDVDKHMLAYIEENMRLRRGRAEQEPDSSADAVPSGSAQEDLFSNLDQRYKVERKPGEEGSVTNSLSMLTAIPEVDLGMDTRLRNIEETEKAKITLSHGRSRDRKQPDDEAHLVATRCTLSFTSPSQPKHLLCAVYRPSLRAKSDADIIRDARREALGLPPTVEEEDRGRGPRMATDEMVMERFKKRMRK
ncbi:hepatocellular carcinoma-associated antigen 59-domain-containing protein [Lactarius akahatsu]|uniref:Hepatocellular carcinoma-associated antigen 59-domain-containing protein n=1 Tax=Lactarius akahatsu TaxID=416441 RepID=A0AAD4L8A3_9AGAM|nr:hepatocellular carcinoma-associated antigen 59-domain-containing protein [Lactarius akahatsu]